MVAPQWGQFQKPSDFNAEEAETPIQEQEAIQEMEDKSQPQWGSFRSPETYQGEPDSTVDESNFGYITRNLVQTASNAIASVAGKYGDIENTAKTFLTDNPWVAGPIGMAINEWVGPHAWKRIVNGPEGKGQFLPTSKELQGASEALTGGFTEPKTPGEKKFQEGVQDIAALGSLRTGRIPTRNQVGIAGFANVGKEVVQELGFNEDKGNYAKMGIWTVLSLLDQVNGPRYAAEMSNRARAAFDPALQADVPRYQARLQAMANNPTILVSDPRTNIARGQLNTLNQNITNGQNSIASLLTAYDGTNAAKRSSAMFELPLPSDKRFARGAVDRVLGVVRDEIRDVGAQNPQALQMWEDSVASWRVIHESQRMSTWVSDLVKGPYKYLAASAGLPLFGSGGAALFHNPAVTVTVGAGLFAANKLYEVGYRVMNDPNMRDYYTNALTAMAQQNAPVFIKNLEKLDKAIKKDKAVSILLKPPKEENARKDVK